MPPPPPPWRPWLPTLLVLGALPALAHNGLPETSNLTVRRGHPEHLLAGATFGALVSRDSGRSWGWLCAESLGHDGWVPESYLWLAGGDMWAATGHELLRSRDGGCSWQDHPFFSGLRPRALASHPSEPSRLWVVTASPGAPNALYLSEDGGDTFSPSALQLPDALLSSVQVAPSDPRRLYVTGSRPQGLFLFRSDDGGATWSPLPQPLPQLTSPYGLSLLRVSESDPDHLWARASSQGRTWVLESWDGGHTLKATLTVNDTLLDVEASADGLTLWLATLTHLYRSREGAVPQPLRLPEGNACAHREGSVLYACGSGWVHDWWLARSSDEGESWEPLLTFSAIQGALDCPAGTPTRELCGPRWPQMAQLLNPSLPPQEGDPGMGSPPDAGPGAPPAPKGCSATGSGLAPAAWVLLAWMTPRRPARRKRGY